MTQRLNTNTENSSKFFFRRTAMLQLRVCLDQGFIRKLRFRSCAGLGAGARCIAPY